MSQNLHSYTTILCNGINGYLGISERIHLYRSNIEQKSAQKEKSRYLEISEKIHLPEIS